MNDSYIGALWQRWQQGLSEPITLPEALPPLRLLLVLDNRRGHKTPALVLWQATPPRSIGAVNGRRDATGVGNGVMGWVAPARVPAGRYVSAQPGSRNGSTIVK